MKTLTDINTLEIWDEIEDDYGISKEIIDVVKWKNSIIIKHKNWKIDILGRGELRDLALACNWKILQKNTEAFNRWELVKVSRPNQTNAERIFVTKIEWANHPYVCVRNWHEKSFRDWKEFHTSNYVECEKTEQKSERTFSCTDKIWESIKLLIK